MEAPEGTERERARALLGSTVQEMCLFFRLRKEKAKEADTLMLVKQTHLFRHDSYLQINNAA